MPTNSMTGNSILHSKRFRQLTLFEIETIAAENYKVIKNYSNIKTIFNTKLYDV